MKLSLSFPELERQCHKIGARPSVWSIHAPAVNSRADLLIKLQEGIEADHLNIGEIEAKHGTLLSYSGEQILLYIRDTDQDYYTLKNTPENAPRFHIAECRTLKNMRSTGRFPRYVLTNDTSGSFRVDWRNHRTGKSGETRAALKVCKNCLSTLNWQQYNKVTTETEQNSIRDSFSITDFFMDYATFFYSRPQYKDTDPSLSEYVKDWSKISHKYREEANWTCESCQANLKTAKSLLHCHHRNGVRGDNAPGNITVLCILCHSEQPFHRRMKKRITEKMENKIKAARP